MNSALTECEFYNQPNFACSWTAQDMYMKHNNMTRNLCQSKAKAYENLLVAPFEHFSSRLLISKLHTKNGNALECLNYTQHCATPRYSHIHGCELSKKSDIDSSGPKKFTVLYSYVCSLTRTMKTEWSGSE